MQGKSLYAVLLSIIAVLALALAVLVIFLLTTYNNLNKTTAAATPTPSATARTVPAEEQAKKNLYAAGEGGGSADAIFNLKPSPAHDGSFLMASITVVYDAGAKSKFLEERTALIDNNLDELKQACIEYFRGLTYEDVSADDAMEKARETLKDEFNTLLEGKSKEKIIVRVVFDKWIIQ